jgi:NADPH:quinone reductase-like Zn-dependent oxidoreductase
MTDMERSLMKTAQGASHGRKERHGTSSATKAATTDATTMRALVQHRYGPPDVLQWETVPVPAPGPGQLRVRVSASSVNARDWHVMRGEPRVARVLDREVFGNSNPRVPVRGTDVAGVVDAVGEGVTRWRPGEAVFGEADAAWAEYAVTSAERVAAMPPGTTFEQAAALPLAGATALAVLTAGHARAGERLLINGASGGVGTFALQLAHSMGLHVTAVCSARNAAQARALGADAVVDYATTDFCATADRYDIVVDLVGNRSVRALRRLVQPTGTLALSGGGVPGSGRNVGPLAPLVLAQILARRPGPRIVVPKADPGTEQLETLATMMVAGDIRPVIDRVFQMRDGAAAVRYVEEEHASGKVILVTDEGGSA